MGSHLGHGAPIIPTPHEYFPHYNNGRKLGKFELKTRKLIRKTANPVCPVQVYRDIRFPAFSGTKCMERIDAAAEPEWPFGLDIINYIDLIRAN